MRNSSQTTGTPRSMRVKTPTTSLPFSANDLARITAINCAKSKGTETANTILSLMRWRISPNYLSSVRDSVDQIDEGVAVQHLGLLGFAVSSAETHFRAAYGPECEGFVFAAMPALEQTMSALGFRVGRNPRDDCFTAWINNPGYSWTGSDGELRFGAAVRAIDSELNAAADLLVPLRKGDQTLADSSKEIHQAVDRTKKCKSIMAGLANEPFPDEFQAMRNFLVPMTVNGRRYEPPNATYAPGWNRLDLAVGNHDDRFLHHLDERLRHMASADHLVIFEEKRLPSITDIVSQTTGVGDYFMSPERIKDNALSLDPPVAAGVAAAAELAKALSILTGVHMGAIRKNLPNNLDGGDATHGADRGVSGRPVSVTEELREMRINHPLSRTKLS